MFTPDKILEFFNKLITTFGFSMGIAILFVILVFAALYLFLSERIKAFAAKSVQIEIDLIKNSVNHVYKYADIKNTIRVESVKRLISASSETMELAWEIHFALQNATHINDANDNDRWQLAYDTLNKHKNALLRKQHTVPTLISDDAIQVAVFASEWLTARRFELRKKVPRPQLNASQCFENEVAVLTRLKSNVKELLSSEADISSFIYRKETEILINQRAEKLLVDIGDEAP